ncbi:hypothetical protein C2845_PM11G26550 [Panicum miliaceum]|uniref:Uncharacterized protein n=1 Tax=Panicum miliaceum TaxID=4540 RepID=A0A3L6RPU0_PANMI|nr:hypothetical protein C2845_PM11G26550 [Panicum miliaceum]
MAAARNFAMPAIMVFLVFSEVVVGAARPLAGEELSGEATAGESIVRSSQPLGAEQKLRTMETCLRPWLTRRRRMLAAVDMRDGEPVVVDPGFPGIQLAAALVATRSS